MRTSMRDESGQTIMEYILLLAIITIGTVLVFRGLSSAGIAQMLMTPLTKDYAMTYKYGHPKAQGWDEGEPKNHPRASHGVYGGNNFRMFVSPEMGGGP